jgi:aspartyl/asparaginyl-tRNA synthetase
MRVYIEDIAGHAGEEVTVRGWLTNRRSSGKIHFLRSGDGTGFVQATLARSDVDPEVFEAARHLGQETALAVTGAVRADERAPGGFELAVRGLEVVSVPRGEYPITPKEHGVDFLLDGRHLHLRHRRPWATMRVRDTLERAIHDFFRERGFLRFDAPFFMPTAVEGTTNLFEIDLFDEDKATSRSRASSTRKPGPSPTGRSTPSGRPSGRRSRRRGGTSSSSGWSSRRWPTPTRPRTSASRRPSWPTSSAGRSRRGARSSRFSSGT